MAYGTANSYARPRRRRRKRKSHYGVLALVIVLLIALIVLAVKLVTTAVSAVIGRTGTHEIVYQVDNKLGYCDGKTFDLEAAPYRDQSGNLFAPLQSLCDELQIDLTWDESTKSGTAEFDGKKTWTVKYNDTETTVTTNGKFKIDGKRVKGDDFTVWLDEEKDRFYISAPALAQIIGRNYTDLGDGAFAFTTLSLDGLDSQKTYLDSLRSSLSDAVDGDIPEADVYIALTFDDGPTGKMDSYPDGLTNYLLDGLKERGAKATFFECGYRIKEYSACMPRQLEEGSEIANHTMNHPDSRLTGLSREEVDVQINSNSELIKEKTGSLPTLLRPVGGGVNDTVKAVAKEAGLPIINWSVDTQDWKYRDAAHVKQVIVEQAGDGDVVLMHDLYPTSVQGALDAIDELQKRTDKTYAFVTVSQLAAIHGITLEPGVVYNGLSDKVAQEIKDGTYSPAEFT